MNNFSYSYSSPNNNSFSGQYSSTPSNNNNTRFQRPRFAYAGPPSYPRPRSSASKPNPDPYSDNMQSAPFGGARNVDTYAENSYDYSHGYGDSMRNNYGDSTLQSGDSLSLNNTKDSYGGSYLSSTSSVYHTGNDSFYGSPQKSLLSTYQNNSAPYDQPTKGGFSSSYSTNQPYTANQPVSYFNSNTVGAVGHYQSSTLGLSGTSTRGTFGSRGGSRGRFQKNRPNRPRGGMQQASDATMSSKWQCSVCSIDFTSQIPLEMHLRGARHAKKLKAQSALSSVKGQITQVAEVDKSDGKKYYCEICNVIANSPLQLQMHLEGTKHKNKLNPPSKETETNAESKKEEKMEVLNGKSNGGGGVVRPAPAEFGDQPKPAKMSKYSCDKCNIIVNSEIQLTQHLTSKKHQAKVEGKPIIKKKKPKQDEDGEPVAAEAETNETELTNVVGVKTLSSSFVQGGTLE